MLYYILGFLSAWIILAILADISEGINSGGIHLWNGWATYILLAPIIPPIVCIINPIYGLIKNFWINQK